LRQRDEQTRAGDGEVGADDGDRDWYCLKGADLGRDDAEQEQREGGGDERSRQGGEHRCEREALRQPRDQHVGGDPGRAADE
jgi:hypothetical protein